MKKSLPILLFLILLLNFQCASLLAQSFTFNYNSTNYTYYNISTTNDPSSPYTQYVSTHPNSGLYMAEAADGHYNCHAFAWPNNKTVWVNTSPNTTDGPQLYYNSGYYMPTTESDAEIVVYGPNVYPNHSAVRLTSSTNAYARQYLRLHPEYAGWFISKWDGGPLVIHSLTGNPYYNASNPQFSYYKKATSLAPAGSNNIKGAFFLVTTAGQKLVCASGAQFTLSFNDGTGAAVAVPTPKTFTITWTSSANITLQNNAAYPLVATANGTGTGYIQATLHFIDGTSATLAQFPVWVGLPDYINSISTSQWTAGPGTSHTITVSATNATFYGWPFNNFDLVHPTVPDTHGASSYSWTCTSAGGPAPTFIQNPSTNGYRYVNGGFTPSNRYATMNMQASNACGSRQYPQAIYVSSSGFKYALYPNPASENVTVITVDKKANMEDASAEQVPISSANNSSCVVRIVDLSGTAYYTAEKTGPTFTIPVSNLKNGNYLVEINDGTTISRQSLVVSR